MVPPPQLAAPTAQGPISSRMSRRLATAAPSIRRILAHASRLTGGVAGTGTPAAFSAAAEAALRVPVM